MDSDCQQVGGNSSRLIENTDAENLPSVPDSGRDNSINAESNPKDAVEVESICVTCGENGTTKFLLSVIPFYKEVILASFSCPHCFYSNSDIQSAGEILPQGVEWHLTISDGEDLNRKVVKSDFASVNIPELGLEIPALSQKGKVTTVEGILLRTIDGLQQDQTKRKIEHPEDYTKITEFIGRVEEFRSGCHEFTLILRDTSGQSFIAPPSDHLLGRADSNLTVKHFNRTKEENHQLGIYSEYETNQESNTETEADAELLRDEVLKFDTSCTACGGNCYTNMKMVDIPLFKEVVIMATNCDNCGHKTNEVKSGGGIEEKGKRFELRIINTDDLSRDILKSETCSLEIPSLELSVGAGTLGGKFTTVEGILKDMREQLADSHLKFCGDSDPEMKKKMDDFYVRFDQCLSIVEDFTIVLDDPAGNSYVQNINAPDDDPQLKVMDYVRSFEQNEELGLNDIQTENYTS